MNPSEMSDEELNLTIANELGAFTCGHDQNTSLHGHNGNSYYYCLRCKKSRPYYTGDMAAAMGLLLDFESWGYRWELGNIDGPQKRYFAQIFVIKPHSEPRYYADSEFLPRAISEAFVLMTRAA